MTSSPRKASNLDGAILLDKPLGLTSFSCISRVKKLLKKQDISVKKIGHCGTLDPAASGLLVVLLGKATKLQDIFLGGNKAYQGVIKLGVGTETLDLDSEIINHDANFNLPCDYNFDSAIDYFIKTKTQIPPAFSAIKVDGTRSYQLARLGQEVELKSRKIELFNLNLEDLGENRIRYELKCSKGFYVRSFARDLGQFFKTYGVCESIRRVCSEPFDVKNAISLANLEELSIEDLLKRIVPISNLVSGLTDIKITSDEFKSLFFGQKKVFSMQANSARFVAILDSLTNNFLGLMEQTGEAEDSSEPTLEPGNKWQIRFLNEAHE